MDEHVLTSMVMILTSGLLSHVTNAICHRLMSGRTYCFHYAIYVQTIHALWQVSSLSCLVFVVSEASTQHDKITLHMRRENIAVHIITIDEMFGKMLFIRRCGPIACIPACSLKSGEKKKNMICKSFHLLLWFWVSVMQVRSRTIDFLLLNKCLVPAECVHFIVHSQRPGPFCHPQYLVDSLTWHKVTDLINLFIKVSTKSATVYALWWEKLLFCAQFCVPCTQADLYC